MKNEVKTENDLRIFVEKWNKMRVIASINGKIDYDEEIEVSDFTNLDTSSWTNYFVWNLGNLGINKKVNFEDVKIEEDNINFTVISYPNAEISDNITPTKASKPFEINVQIIKLS